MVCIYLGGICIVIGSPGLRNGIFAEGAAFVKRWPVWLAACLVVFVMLIFSEAVLTTMVKQQQLTLLQGTVIYRSLWVLSCTLSAIALLTMFKSVYNKAIGWWQSLAANAYGIYLVHYIFVLWCQFLLLDYQLPAVSKFFITFIVSLGMSWCVTYLVRKMGIVKKYL
jgi:glucan biosynthesis protein C